MARCKKVGHEVLTFNIFQLFRAQLVLGCLDFIVATNTDRLRAFPVSHTD